MISFELYCDLERIIEQYDADQENIMNDRCVYLLQQNMLNAISLAEQSTQDQEVFWKLIEQCDLNGIRQLMEYFSADAPIQEMLKKRLKQLQQNYVPHVTEKIEKKKTGSSFYLYLCECVKEKGFASIADFYNYAGISRQRISKLRLDDSAISRDFSLHMAVGLEYNFEQTFEFLKRAGYNFVPRNRRETIIAYVMRNQRYTFSQMEEVLYLFNEKTFLES